MIWQKLQADPPDPSKIREEDIIGVTVLLLTCSYMGQEFMRVGYYVNNDYDDEQLREEPPAKVLIDRVQRNILADKPRVTKFPINFHPEPSTGTGQQQQEPQTASPENHTGNGEGNGSKPEADQWTQLASNILMCAPYWLCCNITNGISGYALPWDPDSSTWWLFRTLFCTLRCKC